MENIAQNINQLIDSGNLDEAERAITDALNQNPDSSELLTLKADLSLKLGSDLWEKGDVDKALDYLTQALEINPSDRNIVLKCGEVLISLEQIDSAKNLYESYLKKNPDDKEITKILRSLQLPETVEKIRIPHVSEKIVIAVNLVPFKDQGQLERQQNCIRSISELIPLGIIPLNICYPDELMHPEGWEVFPALSRSADKELKVDGKRKPFVTDLFDAAAEWAKKHNIQWFIVTNSDIIFTPEFLQEVSNILKLGYETAAFSRHDIVDIDQASGIATGYIEFRGSDVFLCQTAWWENNKNRFQPYIFGERAWDNSFAGVMAAHSQFHISFKEGLCFHLKHPETWITGPYADYNMSFFNGVDKKYGHTFFTFLGEALQLSKDELTGEKTAELIKKYFRPKEVASKPFKGQTEGLTSVVILLSVQTSYLSKCLESIKKHTPELHEVITVPSEDSYGNFISYPEAFNKGIAEAKGEYVVILNDDVIVTEGWLSGMIEHLNSADDIGIVAPMTLNVDGPQGVKIAKSEQDKIATHPYIFAREFRERNRYRRIETINLNGFCMLFRRDLVKKIGFMDERLEIPDFADNDYCLRSAAEVHRNIIAGDVFVYSHRDRTLAGRGGKIGSSLPKISKIFFDKWNNLHPSALIGKKMAVLNSISASNELRQKGKYSEAIQVLSTVKELQPDENKYYFTFSEILMEQNKLIEAINILENMPEALKDNADRLSLIGYCKVLMNQLEDAEKFADNALELNKTASRALNLKGLIALKKEFFRDAENFLCQAIESDKSYNEPYLNLGHLKWRENKREDALTLYEKAFILNPAHNEAIDKFFDAVVILHKLDYAEKIMSEAIDIYPSHKKLRYALAELLLKQGKKHKAMDILQETLRTCGIDDEILSFALKVRYEIGPKEIMREQGKVEVKLKAKRGKKKKIKKPQKIKETQQTQQTQKTQASISLCMIVKNEESNLVNCLSKVGSLVDEIIVVDTGSTDRTKYIAGVFGARVFDFKWTNDFSAGRNFSLSKATGDWILILDADEVISPKDHNKIRELVKEQDKPVAYSFITRNYKHNVSLEWTANDGQYLEEEAGTGWTPSKKVRLFPNDNRIRFENPVHELVEYSLIKAGFEITKSEIPIHHYGKLDIEKESSKKPDYYELGKVKLTEEWKDFAPLYEIAVQTSEIGNHKEALEYWKQLAELKPDFSKAYIGLGISYFELGMHENAINALKTALAIEPDSQDVMILLSKFEFCSGNVEKSIQILDKLLKKEPSYPPALGLISAAYFCSDRKKEGFIYAKKLDETNFDASRFFSSFASTLIKAGQSIYANKLLETAIEGNYMTGEIHSLQSHKPYKTQQTQATISLCMIVKNEEANIEHCLSSVKGLVDEIIVVDTGSIDKTKEIAKEFGAKVFDFRWNDNFSDARNFSLSKATGDWILILDADEVISPKDHEKLKELVRQKEENACDDEFKSVGNNKIQPLDLRTMSSKPAIAYSFTTRNYIMELNNIDWRQNDRKYTEEAGTGWFPGEKVRLFPNIHGIKFEYPIHERIEPSLTRMGVKIESSDIPIHHYGTLNREKENKKSEIYYEMAKKKVFEDKSTDYKALHELAVHAASLGKFEEALEYLKKVLELNPDFGRAYLSKGNNYFNLRRFNEALSSYIKALELEPELKEAIIQAASCELYLGESAPAVSRLEKFIQEKPEHLKALALLTTGYLSLRNKIDAQQIIEKLKALNFDYKNFISHSATTLTCFGQIDSAISILESAIEIGSVEEKSEQLLSTVYMIKRLNENKSKVSIVVLASDNSNNLNKCIESIKKNTLEPHEVIVVPKENSPSTQGRGSEWEAHPYITLKTGEGKVEGVSKLQSNLNYAQAANRGVQESAGDYVVIITDDVIVTNGWLTGMLECAMSNPDIALVGPIMTNVEGPQGVNTLVSDKWVVESGKDSPDDFQNLGLDNFALYFRQKNRYRRINQKKLTGECLLISRELIEKIGLFDENFITSEYALDDYCLKASLNDYRCVIAGDTFVHKVDYSGKSDVVKFREKTIAHNKKLFADRKHFIDKWSASDVDEDTRRKLLALNALRYADELSQQGQKNNASEAILEGLKYSPDDKKLHFALVTLMIESGKFIEAFDVLEKMPESLKKDTSWLELAGVCKEGVHLYEEAEKYADETISLNSSNAKGWNLKGLIAYNKGLMSKAEEFFQKAIKFDKGFGEAYANLGTVRWNKDNREEALSLFERAFILSPTIENIVINYHAVAVSLSQQQRAEKIFREAIDLYPSNRRLKYVLVDLLLQQEKYEEAMKIYEDAMVAFGIDDDTLSIALGIRNKIGTGSTISGCSLTISLCMIVKNEEKYIGKCLHSIKPLVDEMIVVDTGSTDKTKNIAKAFGAKVFDFAWTGDFSEARNYSISKASGDWILVLDADEVIAPFDQDVLRKLLSLPAYKYSGFTITSRNYVLPLSIVGWRANDGSYIKQEAGSGWFPSDKVRIFPNNPHIRFEFPVHEFVEVTMHKAGIKNIIIDIPVHHYGKLEKDKIFKKGEDYYILGKLKLSKRGEKDFIALYELAIQASELERFDEALEYWKKLTEVKPDFPKAFFGLANSYYRQAKFQEAIDSLETALKLEKDPEEQKEFIPLYSACSLCIGQAEKCIPLLEDTLSKFPELPMCVAMLAMAYCCVNKKEDGKKYLNILKKNRIKDDNYFYEFAEFLTSKGKLNYALAIVEAALETGTTDERFLILLDRCKKLLTEEN